mmetsp:Transcript_29961/g.53164  ORF Transcript_29961/g.53164 Transcript_29961/m.53164 type:complete len:144 (-) Transcript_29961:412-843(-)|eukprot:CAMPEP_0204913436 /NCGR_PEP_ID=MMETSP1397-20131031/11303_1 /ASSEMBLY_ACC=CAM_ASM_000891 /TAXON_ID=49980 /ORGANISM="Climacostomum Climacostomum virens, Strain Stock W-24" /LENGTH=143 /DNA_ID=CAMNT_0052084669 /DNA_START=580 /DNA_END=1011 /DNA_ORIENTATION=+
MKTAFCVLALFAASACASSVIEDKLQVQEGFNCDATLKTFAVSVFDVSPWPFTKNTTLKLKMQGTSSADEQLQTTYVNVLYGGQQFYVQKFANTDKLAASTPYTTNVEAFLPGFAPSGVYGVQVKLQNSAGQFLNCWQINFQI